LIKILFLVGGAIGLLESASENVTKRYEEMARKYAAQNILGPINVLWIHHFVKGEFEQADKIWKEYLSAAPRLMFHRIVQVAREKSSTQLIEKLITLLQSGTAISEGAIGNCYSALIDIQTTKGNANAVQDTLVKAVDAVCLENINTTALNRAKEVMEKAGKSFPYTIPEKKTKKQDSSSSSSSSSSDDDVRQKKA
jgi:leucine-rich PPR motif-containing protein